MVQIGNSGSIEYIAYWSWVQNTLYFPSSFAVHGENPPVGVVRKFVHLLDMSDLDYEEEIGKHREKIMNR